MKKNDKYNKLYYNVEGLDCARNKSYKTSNVCVDTALLSTIM